MFFLGVLLARASLPDADADADADAETAEIGFFCRVGFGHSFIIFVSLNVWSDFAKKWLKLVFGGLVEYVDELFGNYPHGEWVRILPDLFF